MPLDMQGYDWYMATPNIREERRIMLMQAYAEVLEEHEFLGDIFGII